MKAKAIITPFVDSPQPERIKEAISAWPLPVLSQSLKDLIQVTYQNDFWSTAFLLRDNLAKEKYVRRKTQLQTLTIDWLYDLIRLNVKRGRVFDLSEVVKTGKADCLGYCKIFSVLGRYCGLDTGVADVILDNRGLAVPHTVALVKVGERGVKGYRFVDFWYGSKNIRHKRLGLRVRR